MGTAMMDLRRAPSLLLLKPPLRAFGLAYASVVAPQLLTLISALYRKGFDVWGFLRSVYFILSNALAAHGFPVFCGLLVGSSTLLNVVFRTMIDCIALTSACQGWRKRRRISLFIARFLSTLISAWSAMPLLDTSEKLSRDATQFSKAGENTIDMTVFAIVRALDSSLCLLGSRHRKRRLAGKAKGALQKYTVEHVDVALFITSAAVVMWAWIYRPDALPPSYKEWIRNAAQVDDRLLQVLRQARRGDFVYGEEQKQVPVLRSMCHEYGFPLVWSDPAKTIPIPCQLVHSGTGASCHWHAFLKFLGAFKFGLVTQLPLQILLHVGQLSPRKVHQICKVAVRSSAFLASFISLFYYGVCLARTQLGPWLLGPSIVSPMKWDQGLCIRAGCVLCGWSVLVETKRKRQELALFVAPRAAATLLPRHYNKEFYWRERAAFSISIALLFTLSDHDPRQVRGTLGAMLHSVLQ